MKYLEKINNKIRFLTTLAFGALVTIDQAFSASAKTIVAPMKAKGGEFIESAVDIFGMCALGVIVIIIATWSLTSKENVKTMCESWGKRLAIGCFLIFGIGHAAIFAIFKM